jgi:hypothetical protein
MIMTVVATVSTLTRYPVKSLAGEPLDSGELGLGGSTATAGSRSGISTLAGSPAPSSPAPGVHCSS